MDMMSLGLGCFIGLMVGGLVGFLWVRLCAAAKRGDQQMDELERHLAERRGRAYHG